MTGHGGKIGKTVQDSQPHWPEGPKRPPGINKAGAPNILVILFDDVGFSDLGCYGSPIETPVIDGLAKRGLRYTGFHTTAMCSTTRAALLTGRNHHSVGVGCLANFDSGYPGYRGKISREAGTIAEMLRPHGYRNYMLGKWHVTPLTESGATGPFDGWPLGRGFDRYYGFMDAETDQFAPELVRDNTPVFDSVAGGSGLALSGRVNQKREPRPNSLSNPMRPPSKCTRPWLMARPSPWPPYWRWMSCRPWLKRLNSCAWCSGAMPMPLSSTSNKMPSLWLCTRKRTWPCVVNFRALPSKLTKICIRRWRSPATQAGTSGATSSAYEIDMLCTLGANKSNAWPMVSCRPYTSFWVLSRPEMNCE